MINLESTEITYEEMSLWRDICQCIAENRRKRKRGFKSTELKKLIANFTDRGGYKLLHYDRHRREALWNFHDCQISLVRWGRQGWELWSDWEEKINWLEKIILLNYDPEELAKPWIKRRENKIKQKQKQDILERLDRALWWISEDILRIEGESNQTQRQAYERTREEAMQYWLNHLRVSIADAKLCLGKYRKFQEEEDCTCTDAVLGSQNLPRNAAVLGGLAGIKRSFGAAKINAATECELLRRCLQYGKEGQELLETLEPTTKRGKALQKNLTRQPL